MYTNYLEFSNYKAHYDFTSFMFALPNTNLVARILKLLANKSKEVMHFFTHINYNVFSQERLKDFKVEERISMRAE